MNLPSIAAWSWSGTEFAPCDSVPLSDRGFRYGMSVFESLPVGGNNPLFLPGHYERLAQACSETGLDVRLPDIAEFDALLRTINFDGFARLYATGGDGGVFSNTGSGRVFVFVEPRAKAQKMTYRLAMNPEAHLPLFGGLKTGNYWANIAAMESARANGFDESLLFNAGGELISACMANVFIVRDGEVRTPSTNFGSRAGVIREWIIARRRVVECRITKEDLLNAEELFLTSSWLGVMPVASLDRRSLPSRITGTELRVEYQAEINEIPRSG